MADWLEARPENANLDVVEIVEQVPQQDQLEGLAGGYVPSQREVERASGRVSPRINDLVIRGYLLSMEEGSATERVAIGLGEGTSELRVAVEGFQVTDRGLRRLH